MYYLIALCTFLFVCGYLVRKDLVQFIALLFFVITSSAAVSCYLNTEVESYTATIVSVLERQVRLDEVLLQKVQLLDREVKALSAKNYVIATVTAYTPSIAECDSTPYTTAFLKKVHPRYVAISRDLLKQGWVPGRKVYIEGIGIRTIGDLMSPKVKGPHVDVFMWKRRDALKFGKSKRYVFLIQE